LLLDTGFQAAANKINIDFNPQAHIPLVAAGNKLWVSSGAANNVYHWYRNDTLAATITGDSTLLDTLSGSYTVVVTNPKCYMDTLYSDTVTITNIPTNLTDSLALVDLYNSTNGTNWPNNTNWLKAPVYTWYGVTVINGRVTAVNLPADSLHGVLPGSLGNLDKLTHLNVSTNQLSGSIPVSLGSLANLTALNISKNQFSGVIPDTLENLKKLQSLDLSYNTLSGAIPASLGYIVSLQTLLLANNNLTGSLPDSMDNLINLSTIDVSNNNCSGIINNAIGNLTMLSNIYLSNNNFSGNIPSSFGRLNNLSNFDIHGNHFSGTIPTGITGMFTNSINVGNNNFVFDSGMQAIAGGLGFTYAPQANIRIASTGNILTVPAGKLVGNVYTWYRNDTLVAATTGDSTLQDTISGNYHVVVTNPTCPDLTLYSDTIAVTALPIKDITLSTKATNGQVRLQWQTMGEQNTASFVVQRSTNGTSFTDLATKEAVGSGNNEYSYIDAAPLSFGEGLVVRYYRIKVTDKTGKYSYSKVVSVQLTVNSNQLTVYPNPAKSSVTISGSHIVSVQVVDNLGRVIKFVPLKDATNPTLSVSGLPVGVFNLRVQTTDGKVSRVGFLKE
jgi:hypothetical protein